MALENEKQIELSSTIISSEKQIKLDIFVTNVIHFAAGNTKNDYVIKELILLHILF